jgi:hypothetical protein
VNKVKTVVYFLDNYDIEVAKKVLAKHYDVTPTISRIKKAISEDIKQRQSDRRLTQRMVVEEILRKAGVKQIEKPVVENRSEIGKPVGQKGLEKYFTPDRTDPMDLEIIRRVKQGNDKHFGREERLCRTILSKRCAGISCDHRNVPKAEAALMKGIEKRCKRFGKNWHDTVRELFKVHFCLRDIVNQIDH